MVVKPKLIIFIALWNSSWLMVPLPS